MVGRNDIQRRLDRRLELDRIHGRSVAHYPAAVSVSPAGGLVIIGTRCEGVTCNVARTVVSPR